jgi:N-hydroxyarylamine O-acetyltransferase
VVTARTHRLLLVAIDGARWLADVGFGGQTPTGILDLDCMDEQETPHEPFRLRQEADLRVLETLIDGEWRALYRFDLQPQEPIDFEAVNFQLALDPASHFTQGITVSQATPEGRQVLRGHPLHGVEMAVHWLRAGTRRSPVAGPDELMEILAQRLGLAAAAMLGLRERFVRLFEECAAARQAGSGSAARS